MRGMPLGLAPIDATGRNVRIRLRFSQQNPHSHQVTSARPAKRSTWSYWSVSRPCQILNCASGSRIGIKFRFMTICTQEYILHACRAILPWKSTEQIIRSLPASIFIKMAYASSLTSSSGYIVRSPETQQTAEARRKQKRRATQFYKRRRTMLQKARDLERDCNVDVCLTIRNRANNQIWQYSNGYVPPTAAEMVRRNVQTVEVLA